MLRCTPAHLLEQLPPPITPRHHQLPANTTRTQHAHRCSLFYTAARVQFDLRNGALRKKFDALKYTLKKLEVRAP